MEFSARSLLNGRIWRDCGPSALWLSGESSGDKGASLPRTHVRREGPYYPGRRSPTRFALGYRYVAPMGLPSGAWNQGRECGIMREFYRVLSRRFMFYRILSHTEGPYYRIFSHIIDQTKRSLEPVCEGDETRETRRRRGEELGTGVESVPTVRRVVRRAADAGFTPDSLLISGVFSISMFPL